MPSVPTRKDGLSVKEAASCLGVAGQTIRNWIASGALPVTRFGPNSGLIRIHPEDLDKMRRSD